MIAYNALLKQNNYGQVEEFLVIKESSFSWPTFFFGIFWFLYQKMWQKSLFYLVNICVILLLCKFLKINHFYLLMLFQVMASLNANNWRCNYLQNKLHYKYAGLFFAKNDFEALQMAINNKITTTKQFDFSFNKSQNFQKTKFFNKK